MPRRRCGQHVVTAAPLVAVLLALAADVAGCGGGGSAGAGAGSLRPDSVAHQISVGLAKQLGVPTPPVTCPRDAPTRANSTFTCTGTLDGQALPLAVTVTADGSQANWHPARAIVSTGAAVTQIDQKFGTQLKVAVDAQCGTVPLLVEAPGTTFTCAARVGGASRTVAVKVEDLNGDVHFDLVAPASGPASSTPPLTAPPTPGSAPASPGTLPGD